MKITVLAGGNSTERDVSLVSGTGVYRALKSKGHQVVLLDVYLGYEGKTEGIGRNVTRLSDLGQGPGAQPGVWED